MAIIIDYAVLKRVQVSPRKYQVSLATDIMFDDPVQAINWAMAHKDSLQGNDCFVAVSKDKDIVHDYDHISYCKKYDCYDCKVFDPATNQFGGTSMMPASRNVNRWGM